MRQIILPGDPEFDLTLSTALLPHTEGSVYVARSGSGLLEPLDPEGSDLAEYLYGGEYDQRLEEIGELEEQ